MHDNKTCAVCGKRAREDIHEIAEERIRKAKLDKLLEVKENT